MNQYINAIVKQTLENTYFRQVIFTTRHAQLVLMCLKPGSRVSIVLHD
jgi:hypothetical protein